jgi:hypothetical protein
MKWRDRQDPAAAVSLIAAGGVPCQTKGVGVPGGLPRRRRRSPTFGPAEKAAGLRPAGLRDGDPTSANTCERHPPTPINSTLAPVRTCSPTRASYHRALPGASEASHA